MPANVTYYMGAFSQAHFAPQAGQDPWEAHLHAYTRFGFDPLMGVGGGEARPWRVSDPGRWESQSHVQQNADGASTQTWSVRTPAGSLRTIYSSAPGKTDWQVEPLVKEEGDLAALAYLPHGRIDVEQINHNIARLGERGLGYVGVNGIWQQACYLRDMADMAMDLYIRPEWAERYLGTVADYLADQTVQLCRSDAEAFFINESYLGMGMSPAMFDRYVRPHDQRLIQIAKEAGKLVLYHDCGKGNALLERFADMGIDYLETLNPRSASGDIDPADAKRRIGGRVCLRGGFNHHLMSYGTPQQIEEEVKACLERLAPGGGYILCPAGPIEADTPMRNLVAFAEAAQKYCGQYSN